jgi:hypothetical protein
MGEFFLSIWREREHYSFVSNVFLGHEPLAHFFSHILSRSSYPEASLDPENIVFMTFDEHQLYEFNRHKVVDKPEWQKVFDLRDQLKDKYNKKKYQ